MQVAILCNHQRAVPKGHAGQMEKLSERMHKLNEELLELQHELKAAEKGKSYGEKKRREPERCATPHPLSFTILLFCFSLLTGIKWCTVTLSERRVNVSRNVLCMLRDDGFCVQKLSSNHHKYVF